MDGPLLFRKSGKRKRVEAEEEEAENGGKRAAEEEETLTKAPNVANFTALGVSKWLVAAVRAMGIRVPTPIQAACIAPALAGRDVVGCAQTGSGKTAAFALPILNALADDPYGIFAVVLTPSRELAFQIGEQFTAFGAPLGLRVAVVTGGLDIVKQGLELAACPHVVVATPGRLAHHLALAVSPIDLARAPWLVLDECDRLADPSFAPDLKPIIEACSHPARQTLLFSATVPASLRTGGGIPGLALNKPFVYDVNAQLSGADSSSHEVLASVTVPNLTQQYVFMPAAVKNAYLLHLLVKVGPPGLVVLRAGQAQGSGGADKRKGKGGAHKSTAVSGREAFAVEEEDDADRARSVIVFVSTCHSAALVTELLREHGIPCASLHSVMGQKDRLASLAKFKSSVVRVLIATDVASRGLDIPTVDLVLNLDVPRVPSDYVHRVGRTARAGRPGRAITLVTQYDVDLVHAIESVVLGGKQLEALPAGVVDEDRDVLPKLAGIATALHLAQSRLQEMGIMDKLSLHTSRKKEGREKQKEFAASQGAH
jgi:ATP-dependent RNA helicase DDX49/DBP8